MTDIKPQHDLDAQKQGRDDEMRVRKLGISAGYLELVRLQYGAMTLAEKLDAQAALNARLSK